MAKFIKKLFTLALSLALVLVLIPVTNVVRADSELSAEELNELNAAQSNFGISFKAKIDNNEYSDLATFFDYYQQATEATVTLESDLVLCDNGAYIPVLNGQNITLDFNGHKIYKEFANYSWTGYPVKVLAGGTLTITDSVGNGGIASKNACIEVNEGGTLYGNGGNLSNTANVDTGDWAYSIISRGTVVVPSTSTLVVNGVHGALAIDGGSATVAGGTFTASDYYGLFVSNVTSAATVNVTGGTFNGGTSSNNKSVLVAKENQSNEDSTLTITGGTFNYNPSAYVADGYKVEENSGLYTVSAVNYVAQIGNEKYESFDEAVAAAQAGDTIVLLDDITFGTDRSVPVWGNAGEQPFNIDLNGFTFQTDSEVSIDAGNNGYKASAFCFAFDNEANITVSGGDIKTAFGAGVYVSGENVNLTLEDVDIAQNYPQNVQTTNEYSSAVRITYEGSVEINGGTYGGKNSIAVSNSGGKVVINDGTFYNDIYFSNYTSKSYYDNSRDAVKSITINGGTFLGNFVNPDKGELVIKGGTFTVDPTAYVAEGYKVTEASGVYTVSAVTYVAQIGDVKYESLADAVAAANDGDTIVLLADLTQDNGIIFNKSNSSVKLNLNGNTFTVNTGSNANNRAIKIVAGTLEVYNGTVTAVGAGTTSANGTGCYGAFRVEADGVLNGHDLVLNNSRPWGLNVKVLGGEATLTNVTINSSYGGGIEVTEATLGSNSKKGSATLTNCTINQENYFDHCSTALSVSGGSELIVNSGSYTGEYALYVFSSGGEIEINGGTFTGLQNSGRKAFIAAIDLSSYPEYEGGLVLNDGNFVGDFAITSPAYASVSGGKYSVDPSAYLVDGYKVESNDDATLLYKVVENVTYVAQIGNVQYETLAAAINAANQAENGVKTAIVLINDEAFDYTTGGMTINAGKVVEIDLNGHQVVGTANSGTTSAFINNYGSLTILDSTDVDEDGADCGRLATGANPSWVWDGSDSYSGSYASNLINNLGTVIVKSGLLQNLSSGSAAYVVDNNSTSYDVSLTVTGGKLLATKSSVRQFANSKTHTNALTVTGGTIQGGRFGVVVHEYGQLAMNLSGGTITTTDTDNYAVNVWTTSTTDTQYANINVSGDVVIDGYLYLTDLGRKSSTGTPATVSISGGYIEGLIFYGNTDGLEGSVTGGHYVLNSVTDEEVAYLLSEQCIADGYEVAENKGADAEDYPYIVQEAVTYVAQIGNVKYETLAAAVAAANNSDTIVLINDATESNYFFVQKNITIDLNGYTASFTGSYGIIVHDGQLTIDDSGVDGKLTCSGSRTIQVQGATGELTVNGGTIENTKQAGIAVNISNTGKSVVINDGSIIAGTNGYGVQANGASTLTINGGTITSGGWGVTPFNTATITVNDGTITATKYAISANGNSGNNATIIINGGYIGDEINDAGIYVPSGSLTVIDGEIVGKNGIYFKSTNLDIRGGSICGVGNYQEYNYNGNGSNPTGDALVIDSCGYPNGIDNVNVSGGHFVSANAAAVKVYTYQENEPVEKFITGGIFNTMPEEEYVAEGYKAVEYNNNYQVGPVSYEAETEGTIEGDVVPEEVTYTVNTIVKEDDSANAQEMGRTTDLSVTVSANVVENDSKAVASLGNIKDDATLKAIVEKAVEAAGGAIDANTNSATIEITVAKGAADVVSNKVTYEVHPEALIKVDGEEVASVMIENEDLNGTFTFKLYAGNITQSGKYVKVTHIHSDNTSEDLGELLVDADGYVTVTGVESFSDFTLEVVETEVSDYAKFGYTISLEESINIIFNVKDLTDDLSTYKVVYTDPSTGEVVEKVPTSATLNSYTIAKCAAKQMGDVFTVLVKHNDEVINQTTDFSIKNYCDTIINGNFSTYIKDLCKATLDYGRYAQEEFNYYGSGLVNGGNDYFDNSAINVPDYAGQVVSNTFGSELKVSFSLTTESQTILSIYLTGAEANSYSVLVNGEETMFSSLGPDKIQVSITDIKAKDLGEKITIQVNDAGSMHELVYKVSPVDYMGFAVAHDSQVSINKAFYNYYLKAVDYFNNK